MMKLQVKYLLCAFVVVALIVGAVCFSRNATLQASDQDGTVTAAQQQEQAQETLSPVEVMLPEATKDVAAAQMDPFENARIYVSLSNSGDLYYGDTAHLYASVSGVEGDAPYTIQWQQNNGSGWNNISGANGHSYSFSITTVNASHAYRAVMICNN